MQIQSLNGTWNMYPQIYEDSTYMESFGLSESYCAKVPGSVLSCLCDAKAIEDPYYRDNEYQIRELFWQDFAFERTFTVEESLLHESNIELVCFGLDTLAEIYINEELLAKADNMHRTWRFPIKHVLHSGENKIRILFLSTFRYMENYQPAEHKEITCDASGAMSGNQYIRKAHSMFGWDWGAQLPDAGIWRDIRLEAYTGARIAEVTYLQKHEDYTGRQIWGKVPVEVEVQTILVEDSGSSCAYLHAETDSAVDNHNNYEIKVNIYNPKGKIVAEKCVSCEEAVQKKVSFSIAQPKLWWPNGLGEQPLYTVKVQLLCDGQIVETHEDRIGLRTFTVSRNKDEWGEEFAFMVNGVKFFAMGADYIPEDCIYSRITEERLEYLVQCAARANYNCLRVWGGGYYPSDAFYDLCDSYGLIVWQDLMYACNAYDLTTDFESNIIAETKDNVKRLRHHASLGLWCGNNELESAWHHWGNFLEQTPYVRADYIKQFEHVLPKTVKETDAQTFYWPSSPSSGGCFDEPDDENRGDTHYWDVWHGQKPFSDYQKYFFRFCSEFGFQSFPSYKTVYSYTEERDRNIFSQVMESHQKNDAANGKMLYYISENFKYPKDFESLLYVTQILQAVAIKSGVEHWRRNRGRCMGTLYWQMNDNWPVASWASIDYYGRWKALHYMAKNFYRPVTGSMVRIADEDSSSANGGEQFSAVAAFIANESFQMVKAKVTMSLKTMDFRVITSTTKEVEVPAFSSVKVMEEDYREFVQRQPRIHTSPEKKRLGKKYDKKDVFVETVFIYEDGYTQTESETLLAYKHMDLPEAKIQYTVIEEVDGYGITLSSDAYAAFVELDFPDTDVIFSDNYISLTNMQPKTIHFKKSDVISCEKKSFSGCAAIQESLQIRTIRDTY